MYPSQQNATDQTANFFWLLVLITAGFVIVWWLFRQWIVFPIYMLRYYELDLLKYSIDAWGTVAAVLHLPVPSLKTINAIQYHITTTNTHTESFRYFTLINALVGRWTRYPVAAILLILAFIINFRHTSTRFRTIYSMQSLKKAEVNNWPQITPVLSLDLVKQDIEKGPWAMAKLPIDFCKEKKLITPKQLASGNYVWQLDRGPAQREFVMQLGPLWCGVDALPIHIKALFVIFAARIEKERDIPKKILTQIATSAASGKLNFSDVAALAERYKNSRAVKWLEKRHAYVYTMMASLLQLARTDGVLASAEFLWLKPVDRRLWYMLNSVGRQTAVIEVAGPFAHWLAEKKVGRALKTPMIKAAVNALEVCMEDILHIPEGDRWDTNNAA